MMTSYVPLRVHGHHSLLSGVNSPSLLIQRAERLGLAALALTDIDSLAGVVDFLRAAEGSTVRPILGAEITDPRTGEGRGTAGRLIALVETETGWRNLCKLVSARHLGEDPGRAGAELTGPADFDRIGAASEFGEGLIFLADHPDLLLALHGRVAPDRLFAAVSPAALTVEPAGKFSKRNPATRAHFGQSTRVGGRGAGGIPGDRSSSAEPARPGKTPPPERPCAAADLLEAARAVGALAIAVPDVYYAFPGGAHDHRVRTAIAHNALVADLPEAWLAPGPAHLLAPPEINALFAEFDPEFTPELAERAAPPPLVTRTLDLAERCRYTPPLDRIHFPDIELPADETAYSRLCELAFEGARQRYRPLRPEVVRRLDYELTSIDSLGFAPYFLLVKRIADFARGRKIPCVGRGSAADSLVSYCLQLTDADPLRYRLPFERFLNPARKDRPDIDLDFCWRRRDEIIEHVYEAFGPERTAMVSTLNTFGVRAAFRETALAEGIPPAEVNLWSKRLPWAAPSPAGPGPAGPSVEHGPVERALRSTPECRDFPHDDERWRRVLRAADALLGTPRHFGLHPGGVVVSPGPITDFTACHASAKGPIAAQFDKDAIEAIGLVKMDLLGNRALTTLDDCLTELASRGIEPDLAALPEDDPHTAELLSTGRTLGCFQVESPGMRNLLQQTGAKTMDDVIQAVALIRPGPAGAGMKDAYVRRFRGLEEPAAPHPRLTELLWDTHGIMLYQEDVMQAATLLAGMDLAEADLLRRSLQKKRGQGLEALHRRFLDGAAENGVDRKEAGKVWELIANFVSFAFCKAHAVTYGRIAYRAVWLKAHHPAVYMAAFLASETGYYDPRVYVEEARRLGVPILPPDVNCSADTFSIEWVERPGSGSHRGRTPCLRIGLRQIKGLSEGLRRTLLDERQRGPYLSLTGLLERTGAHSDEAANLIRCGALDSFDRTRPELLWRLHLLHQPAKRASRELELDRAQLDACRATPQSRTRDVIGEARSRAGGWRGRGLGVGNAELNPGETASLFPAPQTPALVLPGLPDFDQHTRGLLEFELLGLTVHDHPTALFPCPADERIDAIVKGNLKLGTANPVRPVNPIQCIDVARLAHGRVTVRGWLAASRRVRTATGEWMRFLTLEDETALAEVVVFPDVYRRDGHRLAARGTQCVTGVVEDHMGACTVHAERIW